MQKRDQKQDNNVALIVAAGSGIRAGGPQGRPKQYCLLGGKAVLRLTIEAFAALPEIKGIMTVIRAGDEALYEEAIAGLPPERLLGPAIGGATRQLSVAAGLEALTPLSPAVVIIHDAARPFVSRQCIAGCLAALDAADGAIAASPVTDTLKRSQDGTITATISRDDLWRAQTPQSFHFGKILEAHRAATEAGRSDFTDDASIAEWRGLTVTLVENASQNMKITTAEDLKMAEWISTGATRLALPDVRCGSGFDVHAFDEGDHVTLCGIRIPHTHGLKGHSDADAGLHALTDALLGTMGEGDIGDHFPPSDPKWRGADSTIFLLHAAKLVAERGGRIANVDLTLVCERPKIGPHREAMREKMADLLNISMDRVSVKATTSEGLGFTGRSEGVAAFATATIVFTMPGHK